MRRQSLPHRLTAVHVVPLLRLLAGGTMTLAVMTRATLGHTGHALIASRMTPAIYLAVLLATLSRIAAAIEPAHSMPLLAAAAALWCAAFLGFGAAYGPILVANARLK